MTLLAPWCKYTVIFVLVMQVRCIVNGRLNILLAIYIRTLTRLNCGNNLYIIILATADINVTKIAYFWSIIYIAFTCFLNVCSFYVINSCNCFTLVVKWLYMIRRPLFCCCIRVDYLALSATSYAWRIRAIKYLTLFVVLFRLIVFPLIRIECETSYQKNHAFNVQFHTFSAGLIVSVVKVLFPFSESWG